MNASLQDNHTEKPTVLSLLMSLIAADLMEVGGNQRGGGGADKHRSGVAAFHNKLDAAPIPLIQYDAGSPAEGDGECSDWMSSVLAHVSKALTAMAT